MSVCIYHSVLLFKFVFVDTSAFSDRWSHSHPACGFGLECGGPGGSLHCGSVQEHEPQTCQSNATGLQLAKSLTSETKREIQCANHIRSKTSNTKCKQFVNGENMGYFLFYHLQVVNECSCNICFNCLWLHWTDCIPYAGILLYHITLHRFYYLINNWIKIYCQLMLACLSGCWVSSTNAILSWTVFQSYCKQSAQDIFVTNARKAKPRPAH